MHFHYASQRALQKISKNIGTYLLLIAQIIFAFAMMCTFSNINISLQKEISRVYDDPTSHVQIIFSYLASAPKGFMGMEDMNAGFVTQENYKYLNETYGDKVDFCLAYKIPIVIAKSEIEPGQYDLGVYQTYVTTKEFFPNFLGMEAPEEFNQENVIYCPKDLSEFLADPVRWENNPFADMNTLNLTGKTTVDVQGISDREYVFFPQVLHPNQRNQEKLPLSQLVVAPLSMLPENPPKQSYFGFKFKGEIDNKIQYEISKYLTESHENKYMYYADSSWDQYAISAESLLQLAQILQVVSILCFVAVCIGFAGFIFILLNRRKKNIALSMALGAVYKQISCELLLEIGTVILIGCVGGMITSTVISNLITNIIPYIVIENSIFPILGMTALFIVSGLAIGGLAINRIMRWSPNEIISSGE